MRLRTLLFLAAAGGLAYWILHDRPSVVGLVESVTRPLMGSKAAVKESEHNRVVSDSIPLDSENEEIPVGTLREKMTFEEVRGILGPPDSIEQLPRQGRARVRWIYRRARRTLLFEDGRVVSIAIR
ncbi:MAG TPA: hypothetical protein VER78_04855 [Thermoanaerobaculia bacterium]|nr:hypothetical protein [Thermoanaerobaculia bacterium]